MKICQEMISFGEIFFLGRLKKYYFFVCFYPACDTCDITIVWPAAVAKSKSSCVILATWPPGHLATWPLSLPLPGHDKSGAK